MTFELTSNSPTGLNSSIMKSAISDVVYGCLILFVTTWDVRAIAPGDHDDICRTNFRFRPAHDWIPYANDTSSGTWRVLLDQYDYQNLIGDGTPAGVWSAGQFSQTVMDDR